MCRLCDEGKPQYHGLENSRDYIFATAGVPKDLFRKPMPE